MADSRQLYQEVILDHNRKPRNWGALADATHHAEGVNPLCGDRIQLGVKLAGDSVDAIAFEGEACAICKASASMMTTMVKGKPLGDAEQLIQEFRDMATGKLDTTSTPHHLGRLTVFSGVSELPTRVKCAILPWHTLHAALNALGTTTTEADADPMHEAGPPGGIA
jgi:nitrogen fixation protein NifU and related proteins